MEGETTVPRTLTPIVALAVIAAGFGFRAAAAAEHVFKVGAILPMTGPFQSTGVEASAGIALYLQEHGASVAGETIEVITRNDTGAPDVAKRLAQELIASDHVQALIGFGLTPIAMAVAPVATEAEVPMIVTVASTSSIVDRSPFMVRTIQTIPQSARIVGDWSAKNGVKKVVSLVSDYGPGRDAETWFGRALENGGGKVVEKLRVPLANPDFSPFLQRARDDKPDAIFVFLPAGVGAIFAKEFVESGLEKSGVKLITMSDVMDDELLNGMGDSVLGVVSGGPYSIAHDSPVNQAFVKAFRAANNNRRPNIVALSAYDGMNLIYRALSAKPGATDGRGLMEAMKGQSFESARGPVSIDPTTRDIVQNVYMRKVERRGGELYNVEFETYPAVKDPAH
ncbi:MAG: ABC transporter substrate-binding protein [Pseudomonadota bacterium]|nr:ABC transporter substrate-binding protein [Pseudomonadota bacterium]